MADQEEAVVRSLLEGYAARDRSAVLDLYAEEATWHVAAWKDPRVGRDAIGAELDQQYAGFSERRSRILHIVSTHAVVFVEGVDVVTIGSKDVSIHWSSVFEINADGKIVCQRDYWDSRELEAQFT